MITLSTREEVLNVAARLFTTQGYTGTSTRRLAIGQESRRPAAAPRPSKRRFPLPRRGGGQKPFPRRLSGRRQAYVLTAVAVIVGLGGGWWLTSCSH